MSLGHHPLREQLERAFELWLGEALSPRPGVAQQARDLEAQIPGVEFAVGQDPLGELLGP